MQRIAVISITKHGCALGNKLVQEIPGADHWVLHRVAEYADPGAQVFAEVRPAMEAAFHAYDGLVTVFSLGAVIRLVASLLKDKKTDPGIVTVDDAGRFAIVTLSGHLGGGNALAHRVAEVLGATPVVTTASDANNTIAVDLLGREHGWAIDGWKWVTRACGAVVNEEGAAVYQEAGEQDWWPAEKPLPPGVHRVGSRAELEGNWAMRLVITDSLWPVPEPAVVYRPKSLALGIGCKAGTTAAEIAELVDRVLAEFRLSSKSLRCIGTVTDKAEEPGLQEFAGQRGLALKVYSGAELDACTEAGGLANSAALARIGVRAVAEPAALLAAGASSLLVAKQKSDKVTVAVGRVQV